MPVRIPLSIAALVCAFGLVAGAALGQAGYPSGPIRVIIPLAPGGAIDVMVRALGKAFEQRNPHGFVVESRAGGMFAPKGTPADIVRKLNTELSAIVQTPDFAKQYLISKGFTPVGNSSEELAKFIVEDQKKGKLLVDISGAKLEM
jgi:tripartite-type tricarboxylate transporter receptor subunit TctC